MISLMKVSYIFIKDVLNARIKTESITERIFKVEGRELHFFDVAGQKDRRARWAPYFEESLTAVIYTVSLSAYDQVLAEDKVTNRFLDSVELFGTLMNNPILNKTSVIILLNKADLFRVKQKVVRFSDYVKYYHGLSWQLNLGENNREDITQFCVDQYTMLNLQRNRMIVAHVTTATDVKIMKKIILNVQ